MHGTRDIGGGIPQVPQHSVAPCLVSGSRNMASGCDTSAQRGGGPGLCALLRLSPAGAVRTTRVVAIVSGPQLQPEILRRVTGDPGHLADSQFSAMARRASGSSIQVTGPLLR